MTVARMREELSNAEYLQWVMYYRMQQQQQELQAKRARG